jgi:hypothetical protein
MSARTDRLEKDLNVFVGLLPKLEPQEWLGVSRILGVKTGQANPVTKKIEPISAEQIFKDMLDAFLRLNKRRRKNLLEIIKKAVK